MIFMTKANSAQDFIGEDESEENWYLSRENSLGFIPVLPVVPIRSRLGSTH